MTIFILAATALAFWSADPAFAADNTSAIAYAQDAPKNDIAIWTEDGKQRMARGADAKNAPKNAAMLQSTVLQLGDHNIRHVVVRKGSIITSPGPNSDVLIYILKGRVKVTVGDQSGIIGPGDAMRELTGKPVYFEALDEVTTVETNLPPKK